MGCFASPMAWIQYSIIHLIATLLKPKHRKLKVKQMKMHSLILVLTIPDSAGKGRQYRTFAAVSMG